MRCLMYCIFSADSTAPMDCAAEGVGGGRVQVIENNGLAAVVSAAPEADIPKDALTVIAYHKIIDTFHNRVGVIPLRFGTIVSHESEVKSLLQKHEERYKSLLRKLDGLVELTVRVIVNNNSVKAEPHDEHSLKGSSSSESGAAYLARRKAHHDAQERASERNNEVVERYCAQLKGLFVNFKVEISRSAVHTTGVLSVHFLLPRHSVEAFRKAYDRLKSDDCEKLMLSGPWPPYNFVLPEDY